MNPIHGGAAVQMVAIYWDPGSAVGEWGWGQVRLGPTEAFYVLYIFLSLLEPDSGVQPLHLLHPTTPACHHSV